MMYPNENYSFKNSFINENYWQEIKDGVLNSIPAIPSGTGHYNDWVNICMTGKQAGYSREDMITWGQEPNTISENKWNSFPDDCDKETARRKIVAKAQTFGYQLPQSYMSQYSFPVNTTINLPHFNKNKITWYNLNPDDDSSFFAAAERGSKLLQTIFPNEQTKICYCTAKKDQKDKWVPDAGNVKFQSRCTFDIKKMKELFSLVQTGMYFQLNTIDEKKFADYRAKNQTGGIKSEHVATYTYSYIEADEISIDDQKKQLEQMDLPWVAIVYSGSRSLHTIIRLDATSETEFKERLKQIHRYCESVGFKYDVSAKNSGRYTRFPCAGRNGTYQYVIAINEHPESFDDWQKRHTEEHDNNEVMPQLFTIEKITNKNGIEKEVQRISDTGLHSYLRNIMGYRAVIDKGEVRHVRINGHFIEELSIDAMKTKLYEDVKKRFTPEQFSCFLSSKKGSQNVFYDALSIEKITAHTDSKDTVYLYFKNGVLEIKADTKKLISYDTIGDGYLWQDAFKSIEHDYHESDSKGDWRTFCEDITGDLNDDGKSVLNPKKLAAFKSAVGYLLSRYKDRGCQKAILITEKQAAFEGEESCGRSGKGLIFQGLEQLRYKGYIDAKKLNDWRFALAGYNEGQTIYQVDDLKRDFNFEDLYCMITDGFEVEKKCINKIIVDFEHSPKFALTSNFIPKKIDSGSSKGRLSIVEIENYYTNEFSPVDKFGHTLFTGWKTSDWDAFFAFQVECIQEFLKNGLHEVKTKDFENKALLSDVPVTIQEFNEDYLLKNHPLNGEKIRIGALFNTYTLYAENRRYKVESRIAFSKAQARYFEGGIERKRDEEGERCFIIYRDKCKLFANGTSRDDPFENKEKNSSDNSLVAEDPLFSNVPKYREIK